MFIVEDLIKELEKFDKTVPIILTILTQKGARVIKLIDKIEVSSVTNPKDSTEREVISILGK